MRATAGCRLGKQAAPAPCCQPGGLQRLHEKFVHSCAAKQVATGKALSGTRYKNNDKSVYDRNFAKVARASTATVYQRERPHESEARKDSQVDKGELTESVDPKGMRDAFCQIW